MRLLVDTLIALMLVAVLAVLVIKQRVERSQLDRITAAQQSIHALESQALYRAAIGDAEASTHGYALKLDPLWFTAAPQNALLDDHAIRPWVDAVTEDESDRFNPAQIIATGSLASFWYNPSRGLVRARVPEQLSQQATPRTSPGPRPLPPLRSRRSASRGRKRRRPMCCARP
jgi:hypothetical protein